MENEHIFIVGQDPSPEIDFDFAANRFAITGTCYPENTRAFFEPLLSRMENHLSSLEDTSVTFQLRLSYFNSGANRAFVRFFDLFEACAGKGNQVAIQWICEEGDDNMIELAEEFADDFSAANFDIVIEN